MPFLAQPQLDSSLPTIPASISPPVSVCMAASISPSVSLKCNKCPATTGFTLKNGKYMKSCDSCRTQQTEKRARDRYDSKKQTAARRAKEKRDQLNDECNEMERRLVGESSRKGPLAVVGVFQEVGPSRPVPRRASKCTCLNKITPNGVFHCHCNLDETNLPRNRQRLFKRAARTVTYLPIGPKKLVIIPPKRPPPGLLHPFVRKFVIINEIVPALKGKQACGHSHVPTKVRLSVGVHIKVPVYYLWQRRRRLICSI